MLAALAAVFSMTIASPWDARPVVTRAALIPVAIAAPAAVWQPRILLLVSSVLLTSFAVIAGFSIGLFYAPAALTMWAALGATGRPCRRDSEPLARR